MNKMHICIVDDHPEMTDLLEDYLDISDIDCDVDAFNNPKEAIDYLRDHDDIDILITDYHMGRYTGMDVLRETPANTLKIVISGDINREEMRGLKRTGAHFHDKPVPMKAIETEIRDFCEHLPKKRA